MKTKVLYTNKVAKPTGPYSQATIAGNLLFIAGTVATNANGEIVGKGDIKIQTQQILENIKAVVENAGGTLNDIMRTTIYITDFSNYVGMNDIYKKYFPTDPPARATVRADLVNSEFLIEIECVAVIG